MSVTVDAVDVRLSATGAETTLAQLVAVRTEMQALQGQSVSVKADTTAIKGITTEAASASAAVRTLNSQNIAMKADASQIASARTAVQALEKDALSAGSALSKMAAPAALAGIGIAVTSMASGFDTMTTNIRNNTTMTASDFATMKDSIKSLSIEGGASLDSLAGGFMHAFNLTDSATAATTDLSIAMNSAVSTGSDVNATTEALAKTMHQFGIANSDAAKTMDTLHASSAMGNTTLEQFIGSSAKAMVTAASLGISLTDVSSAYVGLTRSGFDAGEANTQLAALMTHIINPTAAAKKEIAALSKQTGVDLVHDFSLAGVQAKGLTGVITDLKTATGGQEDAILKLIPAQRGGIGALALTTSAYSDVIDAGTQLAKVQSGEWTPTADAFALTQQTLGYQTHVLGQAFRQLGIDAGDATIGPVTALANVLSSIPQGVEKAALGFGVAALGVKTLSMASDALVAGTAKLGASIAGDTAATTADTTAVTANTAALAANAAERTALAGITGVEGYGARTVASQTGADAVGLAGYEARTAAQAGTSARAAVGGSITDIGAGIGAAAIPVAVPVALAYVIGSQVVDPIFKGIEETKRKIEETKEEVTIQTTIRYAESADSRDQGRADLVKIQQDAATMIQALSSATSPIITSDPKTKEAITFYQNVQAEAAKALTDTSPQHYAQQADDELGKHITDLTAKVKDHKLTIDEATRFEKEYADQAVTTGADATQVAAQTAAFTKTLQDNAQAERDAAKASQEHQLAVFDEVRANLALGASADAISILAIGKTLTGQDATASQVAAAKKQITDLTTAWKDADTAVSRVDITKGLTALAADAPALTKAADALAKLGQSNADLTNLKDIASSWESITDAESAATAAYSGYMLQLNETDLGVKKLEALKKAYDDAADAALQAEKAGTANDAQKQLVSDRSTVDANIDAQIAGLQRNQAGDLVAAVQVAPNFDQADSNMRTWIAQQGGADKLAVTVNAETTAAQDAIAKIEAGNPDGSPYTATLDLLVRTISAETGLPISLIGQFGSAAGLGPSSSTAGTTTNTGASSPTATSGPVNPAGWNQFEPLTESQYRAIVTQGAGGQPSPLDDQYASVVAAAQKYGVDPRVLLTLTQMESNNGTNLSASSLAGNNYGGIKFANQPGATAGATSPEGDPYASFRTPGDFFNAEAANLTTGDYAKYYQGGDLLGARQHYVAGSAAPSDAQMANIQGTARTYADYATQYPASDAETGGGAAIDISRFRQAVDTSGSDTSIGDKIAQTAAAHLNEAKQATGEAWDNWCEKFVGDVENEAGVANIRPANPEDALAKARAGVAGAGTIVPYGQQQPGDQAIIVAENNPTLNGAPYDPSTIGHTGVVAEDTSKFYNTSKGGIILSDIPQGTIFIRPDGVVSDTPSIGATAVKANGGTANIAASQTPKATTTNLADPTTQAARDAAAKQKLAATDDRQNVAFIGNQAGVLTGIVKDLSGKASAQLFNYFDQILPAETKLLTQQAVGNNKNGALTADQKKTIDNQALAQSLDLTNAVGRAMLDVDQHSANYAADLQKVRDSGGPIGANLAQQVDLYRQIGEANDKITADQTAITNLDAANTARKQQESADDQAASRAKTRDGWMTAENDAQIARYQQGIQAGWQQQQVILTAKQTAEDRSYQDATTAEDRSHTLKMRNLDDQLKSMQKLQTTADSGNSATEVALSTAASGPGDLATKFGAGELLSIQKDFDSRNRQTLTDQIAAITDAQVAENRLYEDDKYNRDLAHTTATRNFQDEATQAADNHTKVTDEWASEAFQRAEIARQQTITDTEAQWQLQDLRAKKDAQYTTDKAAADATLKSDQDHAKALTDQATATSDALKTWGKIADLVGAAGNGLLSVLPALAALAGSGGGLSAAETNQIISIVNGAVAKNSRRLGGSDGVARGA